MLNPAQSQPMAGSILTISVTVLPPKIGWISDMKGFDLRGETYCDLFTGQGASLGDVPFDDLDQKPHAMHALSKMITLFPQQHSEKILWLLPKPSSKQLHQ